MARASSPPSTAQSTATATAPAPPTPSPSPTPTTPWPTAREPLQPPPLHVDDSKLHQTTLRLKRMSEATVRRLARPLSQMSWTPTSPAAPQAPNKGHAQKPSQQASYASRTSRAEAASSRGSSLLPTDRRSSSTRDTDGLGELPEFAVSQRAYLASLLSLFGDGGPGPHADAMLTTGRRVSASGPRFLEYRIHPSTVYRFSKRQKLYVGWPDVVRPPPEALVEFEMEALPLLERDLQSLSARLGQQGIRLTYELRMSGYASAAGDTVLLSPTVWILYRTCATNGAQVPVPEINRILAGASYLRKGYEVQEGGGRIELSSDRGLVDVTLEDSESIKLSDGGNLSVHIEDREGRDTVCGALCCVTTERDSKQIQSLCRVGGLLQVNDKYILGVTTSHAMLDGSGIFRDSFDEVAKTPGGRAVDSHMILSQSSQVAIWHNITRDAAVDFLGISMNSRGEMAINRSKPENSTDFALLRLGSIPDHVRNNYTPPGADEAVTITSTASASAAAMDECRVHIVCGGPGDVADGQLIWGSACFIVRGRNFRVRRIKTSHPLTAGTTGAWVVRGEVLYGVIIAIYENEPYALMMTIERLFSSIRNSAFSIRSVGIWDGQVPHEVPKAAGKQGTSKVKRKPVPVSQGHRARSGSDENRNGEGSSRTADHADGVGTRSQPYFPPEVRQPPLTRDPIAAYAARTEEPSQNHEGGIESSPSTWTNPATRIVRPRASERTHSHASDVTMSGAVQDELRAPGSKQRSDVADSGVSVGASTPITTPSRTIDLHDSGLDPATPTRKIDGIAHEKHGRKSLPSAPLGYPVSKAVASLIDASSDSNRERQLRRKPLPASLIVLPVRTGGLPDSPSSASSSDLERECEVLRITHDRHQHQLSDPLVRPASGEGRAAGSRDSPSLDDSLNLDRQAEIRGRSATVSAATPLGGRNNSFLVAWAGTRRRSTWSKGQSSDAQEPQHTKCSTGLRGGRGLLPKRRRSWTEVSRSASKNRNTRGTCNVKCTSSLQNGSLSLLRRPPEKPAQEAEQIHKNSVHGASISGLLDGARSKTRIGRASEKLWQPLKASKHNRCGISGKGL